MRLITLALATLLLLVQLPLWLGKGGWLRVSELESSVAAAKTRTEELKARNAKLTSEVDDLKDGTGAVEERARYELGMIKQNEVFIQILGANGQPKESATPLPPPPKPDTKPDTKP
ncbi:cell division protein FtsB [Massilia sp. TSP1-1-2]|uniref:cell division protein FtsB n=1 Tax=unclassified Massilia TaxID=2609279 RepID=UPI003CF64308